VLWGNFWRARSEREGNFAAPGKWSVKEVIGHVLRRRTHFALSFAADCARGSNTIPGFEQDLYMCSRGICERTPDGHSAGIRGRARRRP